MHVLSAAREKLALVLLAGDEDDRRGGDVAVGADPVGHLPQLAGAHVDGRGGGGTRAQHLTADVVGLAGGEEVPLADNFRPDWRD